MGRDDVNACTALCSHNAVSNQSSQLDYVFDSAEYGRVRGLFHRKPSWPGRFDVLVKIIMF